jgi:regulator of extracellular matrix RemA (YlzA/DUF370 family)
MATTNFDSGLLVTSDDITSATYDGWTFGVTSGAVDIANPDTSEQSVLLNQSGGRSILLNYTSEPGKTDYFFKSADGSDFKLNSFNIDNGPNGASASLTISGYRNGSLVVAAESVDLTANDSAGNIVYVLQGNAAPSYSGSLAFNGAFNNIDEIRLTFSGDTELTIDDINTSAAVPSPAITSATYDASTGALVVTGTNFLALSGATNDIVANKFTITGEGGSTYTLTDTANVEITSGTAFTLTLSATDKAAVNLIINKNGALSTDISTYNLAAAEDWAAGADAAVVVADATGNNITASNVAVPTVTSATYNANTGALVVTGSGFLSRAGATNDIVANKFTITGEGGSTYTLTSSNVEITSATTFTLALNATDKTGINQIVNKNGTSSTGGTTYNLAAAEDWAAGADAAVVTADASGNGITVSNVATPTITSATYDASGVLTVTGTGFLNLIGASNDIVANKFTFTGEGGATYTLTNSVNTEITSDTAFTIILSSTDRVAVNQIVNKNGISSTGGTTYNLAAAEDWAAGADAAVVVADTTGNGITVSNVARPSISSATYDTNTGALVVTGNNFVKLNGATNDIAANKFTIRGEGGATYTLTDTANVEITSGTAFTLALSATDKAAVNLIINKNGTLSTDISTYNLAAAEDWAAGADAAVVVADATGNNITASNVAVPTVTSATYNANTGALVVTGSGFLSRAGATNDIVANKFTITGEGGSTYTLTDTANVEITSGTAFTLTLSATDKAGINAIANKNGTSSTGGTTYNLAAAEDWAAGADAAVVVADAIGNGITVSNVAVPAITSATYDASTGSLVVTGTNFLGLSGATNDIAADKFTFIGEGGSMYTLTDTANVEITSATAFTMALSATDKAGINAIANKNGTSSTGGTTYNLAAAEDWMAGADAAIITADATGNGITVSNAAVPTVTSATYNASTGTLVVTGTDFLSLSGATNDIVANKFTFTGEGGATYTLTDTTNVEITSSTAFTLTLSATDKAGINAIANKNGIVSTGSTIYNLAAAEDWAAGADAAVVTADTTGNDITVSNVAVPTITSATYDTNTGSLLVTGSGFLSRSGATNDIVANKFTITGEGGATYTLTDTANVEITSGTAFTLTLSATDKAGINAIANKNGTSSTGGTTYNLAGAENWTAGADIAIITNDTTGNGITVSNVAVPTITSATYDASIGSLAVTGTNFLGLNGATNDIVANKFTFTGEGGSTYTLTDTANVEITSATAFTLTLSTTDKAGINAIANKNGTSSTGGTTYNLATAEDWAAGADAAVVVADASGNGITVSNVATPTITSATYDASTGALVVTGTNFLGLSGATNDIVANKFTFTGESSAIYTLTDTANVEITSGTAFTLTLSSTDKTAVNLLLDKNGTAATDATIYNLAAAEDWAAGADAAVVVADLTGNGITATLPGSSPGSGEGNVPSPSTTTIDGVTVHTTTQSDGTAVTTILPISNSRQDDPDSLFSNYADIPVTTNANGEATMLVSLPVGVGLNAAGKPQPLDLQDANNELIHRLEQIIDSNSPEFQEIHDQAQNFLNTLTAGERIIVQMITPSMSNNLSPVTPIIVTGSNNTQMLIIDAQNLPTGSSIQLDNVAFASIIGSTRIIGGSGQNYVVGDDQSQYIVLGADDDILSGGGGNDTVGSLAGNDQTSGGAGDDIVFGGTASDTLSGGAGNDRLNGGLGFDSALQEGQLSDYRIATHGNAITLTNGNGEIDTFTDVESIHFTSGPSLAIAYSNTEAIAHHLVRTWLGRDLTVAEGEAVQNWKEATSDDILAAFHNLPEAAVLQDKTDDELLADLATSPNLIQVNADREVVTSGNHDDQGYLPLGLALNADGGEGYDVLRMTGDREDVHLEFVNDRLELTRLSDGAMLSLKNSEMIAFDSGESVVIAHNPVESILARLVHAFFNRDATSEEWRSGRDALDAGVSHDTILDWFQQHADLQGLSNSDYIETIYSQTLGRAVTDSELDQQLFRLDNNQINREWLAVEIAQSSEAAAHLVGSVMLQEGWI